MQLPGECVFSPAEILPALLLEGALVQRERRRLGEVESVESHQFLRVSMIILNHAMLSKTYLLSQDFDYGLWANLFCVVSAEVDVVSYGFQAMATEGQRQC